MSVPAKIKRFLIDQITPEVAAYLRRERPQWKRQLARNKKAIGDVRLARNFARAMNLPIKPKTVVWESFSGNGALCNPFSLFSEMIDDPDFSDFEHYWVCANGADATNFLRGYSDRKNVHLVTKDTFEYYRVLETSSYLVNNSTFPATYIKRDGQTYLNTWHGTPLKRMGYDVENGQTAARNIMRNLLSADFILAQNEFMAEQMYLGAYRLQGIFRGTILNEGYPRTDFTVGNRARSIGRTLIEESGITAGHRKIAVYAPTWRGSSFHNPEADLTMLLETINTLKSKLDASEWTVLLKAHQAVYSQLADETDFRGILLDNSVPTNSVLAASDLLITDYSSIFVDFLATGRPIAFHIPDLAAFSRTRGLYLRTDELPGPISSTSEELARNVGELVTPHTDDSERPDSPLEYRSRYAELKRRLTPHDDGNSASRVLDVVFRGRPPAYPPFRADVDSKIRILFYIGGLNTNGITSSMLNLLRALDPHKYDVTALYYKPTDEESQSNADLIPPHVRRIIRDRGLLQFSLSSSMVKLETEGVAYDQDGHLWDWETRRILGDSEFDYAVDFSGYAPYWSRLILHTKSKSKAIWQHNDLLADSKKVVDGDSPHVRNLPRVFQTYRDFDTIVSVSSALRDINANNFSDYADTGKFVAARNLIDANKVEVAAKKPEHHAAEGALNFSSLRDAVSSLSEIFSEPDVFNEAQRQLILHDLLPPNSQSEMKLFVTVGRLSPEKNHRRLLQAFSQVVARNPDARLLIIGDGALREPLEALSASLGLSHAVKFTGRLPNPYSLMASSDFFVLSSDYEGQPVVILEARVLGLPIVSTRFDSVNSAMQGSGGIIVDQDTDALAAGMLRAAEGKIIAKPFDAEAYNAAALTEFESALGIKGPR